MRRREQSIKEKVRKRIGMEIVDSGAGCGYFGPFLGVYKTIMGQVFSFGDGDFCLLKFSYCIQNTYVPTVYVYVYTGCS